MDGSLSVGDQISFTASPKKFFQVKEINILNPVQIPVSGEPGKLYPGQVGVITAAIHDLSDIAIGDVVRVFKNSPNELWLFAEVEQQTHFHLSCP